MKSFELTHVSEIEFNGATMMGRAGWGAIVVASPKEATAALALMVGGRPIHPADWLHGNDRPALQMLFQSFAPIGESK